MTVYTNSAGLTDYYGIPFGLANNPNYSIYGFCLCAEGPNAYAYTSGTGYTAEHPKDVRTLTRGGGQTISGSWVLTNAVSNLGTTSLVYPSSGYFSSNVTSARQNSFTISAWIYLTSYPSATSAFFAISNTTNLNITGAYFTGLAVDPSGHLVAKDRYASFDYADATSTGVIPLSTWTFVTFTRNEDVGAYLSIGGTVESVSIAGSNATRQTSLSQVIGTNSDLNTAGFHIDDLELYYYYNPTYSSNFTVPTVELETYYTNNLARVDEADYVADYRLTDGINAINDLYEIGFIENLLVDASRNGDNGVGYTFLSNVRSAGLNKVIGLKLDNGRILNDSESGVGSPRPSTGIMFPRGS